MTMLELANRLSREKEISESAGYIANWVKANMILDKIINECENICESDDEDCKKLIYF